MRQWQVIQQARAGRHSTLRGDYIVSHSGNRTFCTEVSDKPATLELGGREMPDTGSTYRNEGDCLLPFRQRMADQNSAPRPFPPQ